MADHINQQQKSRAAFCVAVIVFLCLSLIVSLATRTPQFTSYHGVIVQSASSQGARQHMDKDAMTQWASPTPHYAGYEVASFYPRFAPAGPTLPNLLFDESLYNRPPPSC